MSVVEKFLKSILKEKSKLTNASSGNAFEERIKTFLKKAGISEMVLDTDEVFTNYVQEIKSVIQAKSGSTLIDNGLFQRTQEIAYANCYVWQPYGQQDFPDFLIFTENKIFTIEIKYSTKTQKKPMWNGNLPKKDALYIFGCYGSQELTIFRGEDILPEEERLKILAIWDEIDEAAKIWEAEFIEGIEAKQYSNEFGFSPYIRRAYQQGKQYNENAKMDFFSNTNRKAIEEAAVKLAADNDVKKED